MSAHSPSDPQRTQGFASDETMASDAAVSDPTPASSNIASDETMASGAAADSRVPGGRISGSPRASSLAEVLSGAEDATVESGTQIGEYVIDGFVGSGAFGDVYRGVHPIIGKTAAIKVLKLRFSVDPTMVSRFVSEARAVNKIGHRAIIDIFAFGQLDDGRHYYIMELLEGVPLDGLIREMGRLSVWETFAILEPIGQALDAAHASGIAHRDLKPDNIFLGREGDGWRPKLLDFGVAKLLGDQEKGHQTATGASVGTPAYMAPEQCLGVGVDHRADIYAFGVVAYQMLTGELPFKADSAFTVMTAHINQPPPKVSEICAEVPIPVSRVVARLLAKRPEDRPASLAEALTAFAEAAEQTGPRPGKGLGWWPWMGLGLVVAAGLAFWGLSREPAPTPLPPIQPTAVVPSVPASEAPASVAPANTAPASVAPASVAPATVRLVISGLPKGARVLDAEGALLGDGTEPITLARGDAVLSLRFEAPGHKARTMQITPDKDLTMLMELPRARRARRRPTKPRVAPATAGGADDLEPW